MEFSQDSEFYQQIATNGYKIRGFFLNEIIALERLMDRFISKHFTEDKDKQIQLIELILATKRVGFESKRQILKYLIDNFYADKFHDAAIMYTKLKELEDFRNVLAHNILDTRREAIEDIKSGVIGFVKYHNGTSIQTYTNEEIAIFRELVSKYQKVFYEYLKNDSRE